MTTIDQPYCVTFRDGFCYISSKDTGKLYVSIPQSKNMCIFDKTADYSDFNDPKMEPDPPLQVDTTGVTAPSNVESLLVDPGSPTHQSNSSHKPLPTSTTARDLMSVSSSSEGKNESTDSESSWSSLREVSSSASSSQDHDGLRDSLGVEVNLASVRIEYPPITAEDREIQNIHMDKCPHINNS